MQFKPGDLAIWSFEITQIIIVWSVERETQGNSFTALYENFQFNGYISIFALDTSVSNTSKVNILLQFQYLTKQSIESIVIYVPVYMYE